MSQSSTTNNAAGEFSRREIESQPAVWRTVLAHMAELRPQLQALWHAGACEQVLVTGCGSPYYAALSVAVHLRECGINALAQPASEVWLNARSAYLPKRTLLIALSRSGSTTEVLRACEAFKSRGVGEVLTISCYPDAPLARVGRVNMLIESAQEESLAQTRAFTSLYLAGWACAQIIDGNDAALQAAVADLPGACQRVLTAYAGATGMLGGDLSIERVYFLGSGPRYGLACELSLKMKEMSISESEPFHFLEFRHGPQTMASDKSLIVGLLQPGNDQEAAVLADMRKFGARVLEIGGEDVRGLANFDAPGACALYVAAGQQLALARALRKNLNPDRPHNLNAVVQLK